MVEPSRVLRPLDEAGRAIRLLNEYASPAELADAVRKSWQAVEQSLRLLLRFDRGAPDELRLVALSPDELPPGRLIEALRGRDLISLELAGMAYELERAAARAEHGNVRAADADLGLQVVERLRAEVGGRAAPEPARAKAAPAPAPPPVPPSEQPPEAEAGAAERSPGARRLRIIAVVVALLVLIASIFALLSTMDDAMDEATAAFEAGRLDEAEERFRAIVEDSPENVTARLYLARIQRRQQEYQAAAEQLREAARLAPNDPDVRRELGHLFMDLGRPRAAAEQYQRAVEIEPDEERGWIGLILALRAAGDPRAEQWLRQAPPEVRAVFSEG